MIKFGVSQGFILGSLLFLIYINDVWCLQTISRFYVDDTALLILAKLLSNEQKFTNLELNGSQWMQADSLVVNTVALIIAPHMTYYNTAI